MEELCEEMRRLKLDYCTPIFEEQGVDGAMLAEASQTHFMEILTSNGGSLMTKRSSFTRTAFAVHW